MIICTDCQIVWEPQRVRKGSDGQVRCKSCSKKRRLLKYNHSAKGKQAYQRHSKTEAFKSTQRRYKATPKGKAKMSEVAKRHYWRDPDYQRMKALGRIHDIEPKMLRRIRERDKVCQHCSTDQNLTFDNIIPVSKGGKATMENLQILCNPCNASKGNR